MTPDHPRQATPLWVIAVEILALAVVPPGAVLVIIVAFFA